MRNLITKALGIAEIVGASFLPMKSEGQTMKDLNIHNVILEKITLEDYNFYKRKYGKVSLSFVLNDSINLKIKYMNMRYGLTNQFKVKDVEGYLIAGDIKEELQFTRKEKREWKKYCGSIRKQAKGLLPGKYTPGNGINNIRGNNGNPIIMEAIF